MINCIIFDCDGTLVDSEWLCSKAMELEFAKYGVPYPADDMLSKFRGVKLTRIMSTIAEQYSVQLAEDFEQNYRAQLAELFAQDLKACDGVAEILPQIKQAMCVASSGPQSKMQTTLTITGLMSYFEGKLFSSYDLGVWKPDPGIFLHAAKTMGFTPSQCLVVEDSLVGVEAAHAAGMYVVHYLPHEGSLSPLANKQLSDMRDLPGLISEAANTSHVF